MGFITGIMLAILLEIYIPDRPVTPPAPTSQEEEYPEFTCYDIDPDGMSEEFNACHKEYFMRVYEMTAEAYDKMMNEPWEELKDGV
jgi:hypothetical protein